MYNKFTTQNPNRDILRCSGVESDIAGIQLVADDAASEEMAEATPTLAPGLKQAYTLPAERTVCVSAPTHFYALINCAHLTL